MDFDGDGRSDILSGSWPGELYLFRRLAEVGAFASGEKILNARGETLNAGPACAVFAADWDGDGDLDLLAGNKVGDVQLFRNSGSRIKPVFGDPVALLAAGKPIQEFIPRGLAGPCVADWDGDGKPDLLAGTGGGSVLLFRNTGSAIQPELAAPIELLPESASIKKTEPGQAASPHGTRTKVCAVDWNADGKLDLLVGDLSIETSQLSPACYHGWVWLFLRK